MDKMMKKYKAEMVEKQQKIPWDIAHSRTAGLLAGLIAGLLIVTRDIYKT